MDALSTVISPTFRLFCSESLAITDATLEVGDPSFSAPFELVAQKIPCARRSILPVPQGPLPAEARTFIRILPVCNEPHAGCVSHLCISRLQKMVDRGLLPHEVIFRERLYRQIDPRTSFIRELQDRAHSLPPREFTQYLIAHRCHLLSFACCMRPLDSQMSEGYEICTNPYSVVRRDESYEPESPINQDNF